MTAYYNEIEPYCNAWLQNLMDAGEIAPGTIDERSILDVAPKDLAGYDRCHFFAGIAGWDYALRLAHFPEHLPVWTGSCPCQPFSSAGRGGGGADERHLWPAWFWLIQQCRPPIIFGEQVASKAGLAWLDVVFSDLEAAGYSVGVVDLCAAGLGAPHIRQRLWFVAISESSFSLRESESKCGKVEGQKRDDLHQPGSSSGISGILGYSSGIGSGAGLCDCGQGEKRRFDPSDPSPTGELADCQQQGLEGCNRPGYMELQGTEEQIRSVGENSTVDNPWQSLHWLPCRDGKLRPTGIVANAQSEHRWNIFKDNQNGHRRESRNESNETSSFDSEPRRTRVVAQSESLRRGVWNPDDQRQTDGKVNPSTDNNQVDQGESKKPRPTQPFIQPLAHGVPQRVGRLRAYGNAIVPQVAATFIQAVMEILGD